MSTKMIKRAIFSILTFAIAIACGISALADGINETNEYGPGTVRSDVTINGTIGPIIISVMHPLTADYAIDPNVGDQGTFISPDIDIENMSKVPVEVTVGSLKAMTGGDIMFTDVPPTYFPNWSDISLEDSETYIALGIQASDASGWVDYDPDVVHYAYQDDETQMGAIQGNSTVTLTLTADFGLAFDSTYTAQHSLVLFFNLV